MVWLSFRLAAIACVPLTTEVASLVVLRSDQLPQGQIPHLNGIKGMVNGKASTEAELKQAHSCLSGKRIVFVGPSTSKSDYMALAYFAEYGRWPDQDQVMYGPLHMPAAGPNPLYGPLLEYGLNVGGHHPRPVSVNPCNVGTAESYLHYSNAIFNGHELCDCYKNDPTGKFHIADLYNQTENRIYVNEDASTMVAYFQWFGDTVNPRGSVNFSPLTYLPTHLNPTKAIHQTCPVGQFKGTWDWYMPVQHFINNFVRNLKPTHLIIDAAYWPTQTHNAQFWDELSSAGANAVMESQGQVMWRTVPLRKDYPIAEPAGAVNLAPFHAKGWKIYDAAGIVTNYRANAADDDIYFDTVHLKPHTESHLMASFLGNHVCPAR